MKILVLNCGSSSVKYKLFQMKDEQVLAEGRVERIGTDSAILTHKTDSEEEVRKSTPVLEHRDAIRRALELLTVSGGGHLGNVSDLSAVGHRVVHGGEKFSSSVLVTSEVKSIIKENVDLAPLHNPANLTGILAAESLLPGVPQVAVFDTAFHATMPRHVFLYPLPQVLYRRYRVRRYGFHGTSHRYVCTRAAEILQRPLEELKIISCHLGAGASVCAVVGGKSHDTSMGFTPLEGLMMGSRCGDLDPGVVLHLIIREELRIGEASALLNKHSGLLGISGFSADMREIEDEMSAGSEAARLAFEMFEYRLRKYIGAYAAAMNGVDLLVFTGGIGEKSSQLRARVLSHLSYLGLRLDENRNAATTGREGEITTRDSRVRALVIPTNEELIIARDALHLVMETMPSESPAAKASRRWN